VRSSSILLLFSLLIGSWATPGAAEIDLKPGMIFEHFIKPGSLPTQIALPEGQWEVGAVKTTINNNSTLLLRAYLFQESEGKLSKFIWFNVSLDAADGGYVESKYCSRDNMHYRKTLNNDVGGVQDCRWLNHRVQYWLDSKTDFARAFAQLVTKRKLLLPNHVLSVGYRIADELSLLHVRYVFSPLMEGFKDHGRTQWIHSIWNKTSVASDPKKLAFVNRLKAWADEWYFRVKAGFDGKLTGTPKPISPPAASPKTAVKSPLNGTEPSSVADRLKKLDALLKQELISKQEYEQKRKEILKDL